MPKKQSKKKAKKVQQPIDDYSLLDKYELENILPKRKSRFTSTKQIKTPLKRRNNNNSKKSKY
jgi:hypothetical protein